MPRIPVYESNVSPNVSMPTQRATLADAAGQGLGGLVEVIQKRQLEQDESETISAAARLKTEAAERRSKAAVSGDAAKPEWLENEADYLREQFGKVTDTLRTPEGKRRAQQRGVLLTEEETQRGIHTQAVVSASIQKNKLQEVEDLTLRAVQKDPTAHRESVNTFLADLESPAYAQLPKEVKQDYARQFKYNAAKAYVDGTEELFGAPAALKALENVRDDMPAPQYTALREHYTIKAKQAQAQDRELEQYALFRSIDIVTDKGGDPRTMILDGVKNKLLTAEQATGLHEKYERVVEHRRKVATADAAFRMGDLVSFETIEPNIRKEAADGWVAEQTRQYEGSDVNGKREIANRIVKKGVEMDYVFPGIKNSMRASPHNAQSFSQAADLYQSLDKFDPYYASKYVSDDQRARFDVYTTAVKGGATQEQALEAARNITPETIAKTRKAFTGEEGKQVRESLKARMTDKSWSPRSMLNGQQAANAVMERATVMLAGNPAMDADTAVTLAQKAYESRNVQMGNLWVPREFMDGVPAQRMPDVAERIVSRLPEVLRKHNLPVADGQYVLAPDNASERDKRLQVYDPTGFPIPGLRFGPNDFKSEYRSMQTDEYNKSRQRTTYEEVPGLGS